jgi:hypothetical protein
MLVQTHRTDDRKFTAASTGLPYNEATTTSQSPVVVVLGNPGRVAGLGSYLPAGWSVRAAGELDDVRTGEIVLFTSATVPDIGHARAALPRRASIVALVDSAAPAEMVAAVLTAGADVCVRGGQPAILASHLVACRRRQLADRWAALAASAQV